MKSEAQEGILTSILRMKARQVAEELPQLSFWKAEAERAEPVPDFARSFKAPDVAIIAEAKRRSPSAGSIRESTSVLELAEAYAAGYAAAISVLTDSHFGGSLGDLAAVARGVLLPTLRKDFIIDPLQIYQARASGAAAILLIVRALTPERLNELVEVARKQRLATLVEIHSEAELEIAIGCAPTAIGVNARDLETLQMHASLHEALLPRIPGNVIAVAESGLATREDVARVAAAGADAVLIGTAVAKAMNPTEAVKALVGVQKARGVTGVRGVT